MNKFKWGLLFLIALVIVTLRTLDPSNTNTMSVVCVLPILWGAFIAYVISALFTKNDKSQSMSMAKPMKKR